MKLKYIFFVMLSLVFISCNSNKDKLNQTEKKIELKSLKLDGVCEIKVPIYFYEMNDIHPEALIQAGYIQERDSLNIIIDDEIYAIVLVNYKAEIDKAVGDTLNVDLRYLYNTRKKDLYKALDDFSEVIENPKIQIQNNINSIHNEFFGRLGEYLVYYQLRIYETEIGYFQVLTWCMQDHLSKHKNEMFKITSSFKEI